MSVLTGSPQFSSDHADDAPLLANIDQRITALSQSKAKWARTSPLQRIELLTELQAALGSVADAWVAAGCEAKGHALNTPAVGDEWLGGPCSVARNLRLLKETLLAIEQTGRPRLPNPPRTLSNGQLAVNVFPASLFDRLLFSGLSAEVRMQPDVTSENFVDTLAQAYSHHASKDGALCLVLCAGNVSSIGPMDALYKLFVENEVCLLKMNPVNEYLADVFATALAPLIRRDFVAIVKGGASLGKYLCEHSEIDAIHITGSDKTHDAIVFGSGDEQQERKLCNDPINGKRITSELGNVSPVIVVPGPWTKAELNYQAENIATMLINNAGFNCVSARVLVTQHEWPLRDALLAAVERVFAQTPRRRAYYPGAASRFADFVAGRDSSTIQQPEGDTLPWTLIRDLDAEDANEICFRSEAFCSVMGATSLRAGSADEFIRRAVQFANDVTWGSLSVNLLVHPKSLRDRATRQSFEQAIDDLRYGTVSVNHWAAISYGLVTTPWGAYPGHTPTDIQSGIGVVHNTLMFDRPQKTVLRGPFRAFPKPVWFATHRQLHHVGPALFQLELAPSWSKLPAVAWRALG